MQTHNGFDHVFRRHVAPEIGHVKAVIFKQQTNYVLADIVNVAVYGSDHEPAFFCAVFLRHRRFYALKRRFCRLGAHQELRQIHGVILKALADGIERGNDLVLHDIHRSGGFQHLFAKRRRLILEPLNDRPLQLGAVFGFIFPYADLIRHRGCLRQ